MDMQFLTDIHWAAVFVAGAAYFGLGALWYSKLLFAKKWLVFTKINASDPNATRGMGAIMGTSLLLMILANVGLSILASQLDLAGWINGVKLGMLTGICFGTTAISISYLYEKRPMGLHLINGGYTLVGNIIGAVIICCWR